MKNINFPEHINVGAVAISNVQDDMRRASLDVLKYLFFRLRVAFPEYKTWLFSGNSAWQENNRIVKYKKYWKSLKRRGLDIKGAINFFEYELKNTEGELKFFGAACISELSLNSVNDLLFEGNSTYIVSLPEYTNVEEIVQLGWVGVNGSTFDNYLVELVVRNDGLILKQFFGFCDLESGFIILAKDISIEKSYKTFGGRR